MDVLILTAVIPYPLSEGGKISQFAIIDRLRFEHNITLAVCIEYEEDRSFVDSLTTIWANVEIISFDTRTPSPEVKRRQKPIFLSRLLRGVETRLVKNSSIAAGPHVIKYRSDFENPYIVNIGKVKSRKLVEGVASLLASRSFDIVQIEFIEFADLRFLVPSHFKKILVHHEIRFMRLQSKLVDSLNSSYEKYIIELIKDEELKILNQFDGIITFSDDDREVLRKHLPGAQVFKSPFSVLDSTIVPITKAQKPINKLIFVGGENHFPNKDAVDWFSSSVLSEVYNRFKLELYVYGHWSFETINSYAASKPQVKFLGFVEDMKKHFEGSIMVSPVRIGSGIRSKILYAMAQGVPVISTTLGCEGIPVVNKESILIADTPEQYVTGIEVLIRDEVYRNSQIEAAQKVILANFTQEVGAKQRSLCYESIV